jgi:peptidoglycan hydrolase-like protein with peptidoglycan-binding domain
MLRNLTSGCTGADVRALQQVLNFHLYAPRWKSLAPDGIFGPLTKERVLIFQSLNRLTADAIVGYKTREILLDSRTFTFNAEITPVATAPKPQSAARSAFALTSGRPLLAQVSSPVSPTVGTPPPAGPATLAQRTVQVNVGQQVSVNPFFFSPVVMGGQVSWMFRRDGSFDSTFTAAGQFAFNQQTGPKPNGGWTGQGSVQWGPNGILKLGAFDLLNPFVTIMLSQNQGQPPSVGLGLGNQINWTLWSSPHPTLPNVDKRNLGLFVNGQIVTNTFLPFGAPPPGSLPFGRFSAPGGQVLFGASWTMDWTPTR